MKTWKNAAPTTESVAAKVDGAHKNERVVHAVLL
jgi:hypothetical protein